MRFQICAGVVLAAALFQSPIATGEEHRQVVGAWLVSSDKDPFSDKTKMIAATGSGGTVLAVRCFPDGLSVILMLLGAARDYEAGDKVHYKYRADDGEITELNGEAFGKASVELPNAAQILKDAQKAKSLAFQISTADASISTVVFPTRGAPKALQKIQSDCGS